MSRTVDEERRAVLLAQIVAYVTEHGFSNVQLRPLAKALGSSPRGVLYYFGSKENLLIEVLESAGAQQRAVFAGLPREDASYARTVRGAWAVMSAPQNEGIFRLFFEVYGLALQERGRFPGFFERAVHGWLAYLEAPALRAGATPEAARALATLLLAGFRGFLLDLCATGERQRLAGAVELWITALDAIPVQILKPAT